MQVWSERRTLGCFQFIYAIQFLYPIVCCWSPLADFHPQSPTHHTSHFPPPPPTFTTDRRPCEHRSPADNPMRKLQSDNNTTHVGLAPFSTLCAASEDVPSSPDEHHPRDRRSSSLRQIPADLGSGYIYESTSIRPRCTTIRRLMLRPSSIRRSRSWAYSNEVHSHPALWIRGFTTVSISVKVARLFL